MKVLVRVVGTDRDSAEEAVDETTSDVVEDDWTIAADDAGAAELSATAADLGINNNPSSETWYDLRRRGGIGT